MRVEEFSEWLIGADGRDKRQTSDNVSRVKRVENALSEYLGTTVDLDTEYQKDKCNNVLEMLSNDFRPQIPNSINLPYDKNGLSSLRTAINKYISFCTKSKPLP